MTYDEMYPNAADHFISAALNKLPPVIKLPPCDDDDCPSTHKCEICDRHTTWVNGTAGVMVCGPECNEKLWNTLFMTVVAQQIVRGP